MTKQIVGGVFQQECKAFINNGKNLLEIISFPPVLTMSLFHRLFFSTIKNPVSPEAGRICNH